MGARSPHTLRSDSSSPASGTATRTCLLTWRAPSTTSAAADSSWDSARWYEKDYTTYGYDFGTFGSRFDLFDESLIRIENRLAALTPPPVRKLPILIGGTGPKRSLPAIARHADIWHAFQDLDAFRRSSDRVDELAATFGRNGADIERSTLWENPPDSADAFRDAGVTLFQTELTADNGYDLTSLKQVIAWRDNG